MQVCRELVGLVHAPTDAPHVAPKAEWAIEHHRRRAFASDARWRMRRKGQAFERHREHGTFGVHQDIDGIEGATENGNTEVLEELDGRTDEEDCGRTNSRKAKTRRTVQPDPEQQDE